MYWWPFVRLFVCPVPEPNSRTEGRGTLKIDNNEAHDTGDQWPRLEVERSNICQEVGKCRRRTAYVLYSHVNV